jgi:2-polyprenyl-6-hydroxyphenyl methylase/3-demethylubiquinone-9 3-methyltransferase
VRTIDATVDAPADTRFSFGKNWTDFLAQIQPSQIDFATKCLAEKVGDLAGKTFLDIGCGSGIHGLAALHLGADRVHSFDYDADSVAATKETQRRFGSGFDWTIERGSALDSVYLAELGVFDVVYSWGVLHHTGDMWQGLANAADRVAPNGLLFISIYNDQGMRSRLWTSLKRKYVNSGPIFRRSIELLVWCLTWGVHFAWESARLRPSRAYRRYRDYGRERGMSAWHDVVDWAGGYPFEVASPDAIFEFSRDRGFVLERLKTCAGGKGCNQFVFRRVKSYDAR